MNGTSGTKLKRLTALTLAVCMTLALLPLAALAEGEGGGASDPACVEGAPEGVPAVEGAPAAAPAVEGAPAEIPAAEGAPAAPAVEGAPEGVPTVEGAPAAAPTLEGGPKAPAGAKAARSLSLSGGAKAAGDPSSDGGKDPVIVYATLEKIFPYEEESTGAPVYVGPKQILGSDGFFEDLSVSVNDGVVADNVISVDVNNGVIVWETIEWNALPVYEGGSLTERNGQQDISELVVLVDTSTVVTNNGRIGGYVEDETAREPYLMTYGEARKRFKDATLKLPDGAELADDDPVSVYVNAFMLENLGAAVRDEDGNFIPEQGSTTVKTIITNAEGGVVAGLGSGHLVIPIGQISSSSGEEVSRPGAIQTNEGYVGAVWARRTVEENGETVTVYYAYPMVETNAETGVIDLNQGIVGGHVMDQNYNPIYDADGALIPAKAGGSFSIFDKDGKPYEEGTYDGSFAVTAVGLTGGETVYGWDGARLTAFDPAAMEAAAEGEDLGGNFGTIGTNGEHGIVITNREGGVIGVNYGAVGIAKADGTSKAGTGNSGTIDENYGPISQNDGTVTVNGVTFDEDGAASVGSIGTNNGTVTLNDSEMDGDGVRYYAVIVTNYGEVTTNGGTVTTNGAMLDGDGNAVTGTIGTNSGSVTTNEAVTDADGVRHGALIGTNYGTVGTNEGEIGENAKDGVVTTNAQGGVIGTNYGNVGTNEGEITENAQGGIVTTNAQGGKIGTNNGTVTNANEGEIVINNAEIGTNGENGTIGTNNSTVTMNDGTIGAYETDEEGNVVTDGDGNPVVLEGTGNAGKIVTNNGTVLVNRAGGAVTTNSGAVENNEGTVETNLADGVVDNYTGGGVTSNEGTVYNYGGTVTTNVENKGKEFFTVEVETENAEAEKEDGFSSYRGTDSWVERAAGATIRLTPNEGYEIMKLDLPEGVEGVKNKDGSWTLTVTDASKLGGKLTLSALRKALEEAEGIGVRVRSKESRFHLFWLEAARQVLEAEENALVEIDAGDYTCMERVFLEALAERTDVSVSITYGNNGSLTIDAGTDVLGAVKSAGTVSFTTFERKLAKLLAAA